MTQHNRANAVLDLDALDRLIDRLEADRFARDPLHAAIQRLRRLEQVREAAVWLVQTWGDGPKDVSGDSTVENDLRKALEGC